MKWLGRFLAAALALLVLAGTAVHLAPLDAYVPEVERRLGGVLHEKVSIRKLRPALLPLPHLELLEVRVGGQDGIVARSVDVQPDLSGLLAGRLSLRRVVVREGVAHLAQIRKMVALFADATAAQGMALHELQFAGMMLAAPEMTLGPLEGRLELTPAGQLKVAWLAMDEQKATVTLLPEPEHRLALVVQAHGWTPPRLPQLPLDELLLVGVADEEGLVVQRFDAASRGIRVAGSGKAVFSGGWRVEATLSRMDAPLERLMALLGRSVELSGALSLKGTLECSADTPGRLKDNFRFVGDASIRRAGANVVAGSRRRLAFDEIGAHVVARPERLELGRLNAKLYGGRLSGSASIDRRKSLLDANIVASGIALKPLAEALSNEVSLSGRLDGAAKFSMRLDNFERFPGNLQLAGDFHVRDGVLGKVDLARAAGNFGKDATGRGTTRFDDLTGLLGVDAAGYHFRKIKISSGSLRASGSMDISPSLQLNGALDADVKGTAGLVSMPLAISGTLEQPVIGPSKLAVAGAAVGTAILGPGLGTTIGIKVGGFLNRLFGKDGDKTGSKEAASAGPAKK